MSQPDVHVVQASLDQQPVLAQLLELYTYDFSFFRPFDLKDDGRYGYAELPLYWSAPERIPYLVWADKKLAGFALLHDTETSADEDPHWDVAEFFILPRFRSKGVSKAAANTLWDRHPGRWQVRTLAENKVARAFWHKTIAVYLGHAEEPRRELKNEVRWLVYDFRLPAGHGARGLR